LTEAKIEHFDAENETMSAEIYELFKQQPAEEKFRLLLSMVAHLDESRRVELIENIKSDGPIFTDMLYDFVYISLPSDVAYVYNLNGDAIRTAFNKLCRERALFGCDIAMIRSTPGLPTSYAEYTERLDEVIAPGPGICIHFGNSAQLVPKLLQILYEAADPSFKNQSYKVRGLHMILNMLQNPDRQQLLEVPVVLDDDADMPAKVLAISYREA